MMQQKLMNHSSLSAKNQQEANTNLKPALLSKPAFNQKFLHKILVPMDHTFKE